jgi:predicted CoA-binding protein
MHTIDDFLAQKRIAMVGISRQEQGNFSLMLFRELQQRGYDVVPVNPQMKQVEGRHCFARVQGIEPPVDGALLMTSPEATETVVRDCAEAGIKRVWMYRASGKGAVSEKAVKFCVEHGITVVAGECPYMFLPGGMLHHIHGFMRKVTGRYPKRPA